MTIGLRGPAGSDRIRRLWNASCATPALWRSSARRPTPLAPVTRCGRYLRSHSDYELYLVNPTLSEVDGTPVYPSLADLPVVPDLVDVFRRHEYLPSVLDDTIAVGRENPVAATRVCGTSRSPATAKRPACRW